MKRLKKILIPTDFSEYSLSVIDNLPMLNLPREVRVIFLHVQAEHLLTDPVFKTPPGGGKRDGAGSGESGESLDRLAAERLAEYSHVKCIVRRGDPATEIVRLAESEKADLILMATHGRTGLAHIFLGSVAEKVVRTSHVPVLTVKPAEMRQPTILPEDVKEQLHFR